MNITNVTMLKTLLISFTFLVLDQVSSFTSHARRRLIVPGINNVIINNPTSALVMSSTASDQLEKPVEETKSYLEDGFVFGLEGSGLSRPKGKVSQIVVEGDSLETTPAQVAIVSATFINHSIVAMYAIGQLISINGNNIALSAVQSVLCIFSSWVLADLGSGVLHWSVDNYGNGRTPIMGNIIAAFQGHHTAPWTITERGFCNNVYKLCIPFGIPTVAAIAFLTGASHPMGT